MIRTPSRISTNQNYEPWNNEENAIFNKASAYSRTTPLIPEWNEIRLFMIGEMQKGIMGQMTAQEIADSVTKYGNELLAEAAE